MAFVVKLALKETILVVRQLLSQLIVFLMAKFIIWNIHNKPAQNF